MYQELKTHLHLEPLPSSPYQGHKPHPLSLWWLGAMVAVVVAVHCWHPGLTSWMWARACGDGHSMAGVMRKEGCVMCDMFPWVMCHTSPFGGCSMYILCIFNNECEWPSVSVIAECECEWGKVSMSGRQDNWVWVCVVEYECEDAERVWQCWEWGFLCIICTTVDTYLRKSVEDMNTQHHAELNFASRLLQ